MLKPIHFLLSATIAIFTLPVHAQYTQMVVDDQNQVLPIFFTNPNSAPPPTMLLNQQRYPTSSPIVRQPPQVVSIPPINNLAAPARQPQRASSNPLTGPYFISPTRHKIMESAHAALGIPYIYGGNNPSRGLDCSSLMQFIHKRATGISLPRTAAAQRDRSKTVSFRNLQPGDLLFYKINSRTNHVGIYIGHGKFIHASSSNRRAVIASMELPYWKKRFVKFGSYLDS